MFDYSVAITLKLNDLVSEKLGLLTREFEKIQGLSVELKEALSGIASATNATKRAFDRATLSAAAFYRQLMELRAGGAALPAMPAVTRSAMTSTAAPKVATGSRGGGGHGGDGGIHGGDMHVGPEGVGMGAVGVGAGDLWIPVAAAGAASYAGKALFESAKDLDTARNQFKLFGLTPEQNAEAFRFVDSMKIYGRTLIENQSVFNEGQGIGRESGLKGADALEFAKMVAPIIARLDFVNSSLDDESAARMHAANVSMLKFAESAGGLKNSAEFERLANIGYKLNISSGGTVDWQQLRGFQAKAGGAASGMTAEGYARAEPLIAERGGAAVGTGVSTGFNRLTGSIKLIPNQAVHALLDYGIWDRSKVILNEHGGVKSFKGNPLGEEKTKLLRSDFVLFYETVLHPLWDKMKLSESDRVRNNILVGGTTEGRNFNDIERFMQTIERSVAAVNQVKDLPTAGKQLQGSLTGEQKEFEAAWTDFKTQWGTSILPQFSAMLRNGADVLRAMNRKSSDNYLPPATLRGPASYPTMAITSILYNGLNDAWNAFGRFVNQGREKTTVVNTQVNLDGRKIATAVTRHQSQDMNRPENSVSNHDGSLSLVPPGTVAGLGW